MDLRHLPNGGNELRRDEQLHANKIHHLLTASLRLYDQEGSSSRIKLWELQYRFSNIIAFTDPFFLPRFSNFALSARELDIQNGRVDFNIGGLIPHPEICVKQTPPVVLPRSAFRYFRPRGQPPQGPNPPSQIPPPIPPRPENTTTPRDCSPAPKREPQLRPTGMAVTNALRHESGQQHHQNPLGLQDEDMVANPSNPDANPAKVAKTAKKRVRTQRNPERAGEPEETKIWFLTNPPSPLMKTLATKMRPILSLSTMY